jgi:hypothetical protein
MTGPAVVAIFESLANNTNLKTLSMKGTGTPVTVARRRSNHRIYAPNLKVAAARRAAGLTSCLNDEECVSAVAELRQNYSLCDLSVDCAAHALRGPLRASTRNTWSGCPIELEMRARHLYRNAHVRMLMRLRALSLTGQAKPLVTHEPGGRRSPIVFFCTAAPLWAFVALVALVSLA